ncbi:RHS repeat domain-containing protein [Mitsuaria sp. 7]|uniref:RHS repeat domain-containing protein n=1 Tax=Mitsuaria sp. 7 TaxID=1658665 RepID=UPI0007DE06A4|nr:RHS repeat-associated core domain-containing protein [Mitsuaria sp. 7]ANH67613.1 hypothetical protein ABE85_08615 [Mitsuaria sp. 7]
MTYSNKTAVARQMARWTMAVLGAVAMVPAVLAQTPANPYSYSRTSAITYRADGLVDTETVEPDNPQQCTKTTHGYDDKGNRTSTQIANCANASGTALFTIRSSSVSFVVPPTGSTEINGSPVSSAEKLFAYTLVNAAGHNEVRRYDPRFGVVTWSKGPNQLTTKWVVDDFGRKTKEIRADDTKTVIFYCLVGPSVDTSSNSPECAGLSLTDKPEGAWTLVHSEPRNNVDQKMGPYTRVYSDALGREIRSAAESFDGAGQSANARLVVKDTVYDEFGAKVLESQPYFLALRASRQDKADVRGASRTTYDRLGRPTEVLVRNAKGTVTGNFGDFGSGAAAQVRFEYNGLTVTTITVAEGGRELRKVEERNVNGQTVRVTDPAGATLAHQHDAFGNLIESKDALQNRIVAGYDLAGRKVSMNDPDAGASSYAFDALGQMVAQRNANQLKNNTSTTMVYDKLGRMTLRAMPEYASSWYYDSDASNVACGNGRLCEVRTNHGLVKRYGYDGMGRPIGSRSDVMGGPSMATALSYEAATGRPATQTYPSGLQVSYGYTAGGFLNKLSLATAVQAGSTSLPAGTVLWEAKAKTAWGGVVSEQLQNGVAETHTVDEVTGQLYLLVSGTGGAGQAVDREHYWDVQGNLIQRVDNSSGSVLEKVTETFVYGDALNRLTSYTVAANGVPNGSRTVTMTYNALGMMLSKSDAAGFVYGAQGPTSVRPHAVQQVLGSTGGSYVYDDAGNLLSAGGAKYSSIRYTSFNLPDGQDGLQGSGTRYQWQYDESTARIRETRTTGGTTRTTWYLHPDNQGGLGFERETGGTGGDLNRHYISTGSSTLVVVTSGVLPALAAGQTQPSVLTSVSAGKLEYWHKDHLGSIVATTDQTGAVTARYAYDPFGKRRYVNGRYDDFGNIVIDWNGTAAGATDRGFTGHEHLDDVGIVHMNGRLFDSNLGVFLQPDPFIQSHANLQDYQRYGYCSSNPMTCTDPTGYFKFSDVFTGGKTFGPGSFFSNFFLTSMSDPLQYWTYRTVARNKVGYQIGSIAIGVLSTYCNGLAPVCAAIGAAEWSGFAGNSIEQNIRAGAFAGISAYANKFIGDTFTSYQSNVAAHAAWGCIESVANKSNCGSGALSGAASTMWAHSGFEIKADSRLQYLIANTISNALVGGAISAAAGGDFWVGARSSAFAYLFNQAGPGHGGRNGLRGGPKEPMWGYEYPDIDHPFAATEEFKNRFFGSDEERRVWFRTQEIAAGTADVREWLQFNDPKVQLPRASGPLYQIYDLGLAEAGAVRIAFSPKYPTVFWVSLDHYKATTAQPLRWTRFEAGHPKD